MEEFLSVLIEPTEEKHDSGYPIMKVWGLPTNESYKDTSKRVLISGCCDSISIEVPDTMAIRMMQMEIMEGKSHFFCNGYRVKADGVSTVILLRGERSR